MFIKDLRPYTHMLQWMGEVGADIMDWWGTWSIGELGRERSERRLVVSGSTSDIDICLPFLRENALLKELRSCRNKQYQYLILLY